MVRILHVLTSPRAEGTPRLVLDWLTTGGNEQGVAFLTGSPADLLDEFRRSGCWLRVGNALVPGPRKFLEIPRLTRRWVLDFRPDLIVAWPMGFSHWVFLGARAARSRAGLLSHAGNPPAPDWWGRYVMTWLCLWTTALCRGRVVACSRTVRRLFLDIPLVPRSSVGFAYNSVRAAEVARRADAARAARIPGGIFRAVMVATLEPHKDHATLLRAAKILRDRGARIEILLAGAGRLDGPLRIAAAELGVDDMVKFLGARIDVPEILGQCDLFVLSTTGQEGRPGAVLEALAAGLPIVASDVAPLREVLEDGRWGKLVRAGDPAALAMALGQAMEPGPRGGAVPGPGRDYASEFTPDRMVRDYLREARP